MQQITAYANKCRPGQNRSIPIAPAIEEHNWRTVPSAHFCVKGQNQKSHSANLIRARGIAPQPLNLGWNSERRIFRRELRLGRRGSLRLRP